MAGNVPGSDPQREFVEGADLSHNGTRRAITDFAEAHILTEDEFLSIVHRLNPNIRDEMTLLFSLTSEDIPFEIAPVDFERVAAKIDPHTCCGSYAILILQEAHKLTDKAFAEIKERTDVSKIDLKEQPGDFATTLTNLIEAGILVIDVRQRPLLPPVLELARPFLQN